MTTRFGKAEMALEPLLGYEVNRLARQFGLAAQRRLARLGVQPGQLPILLAAYEREDRTQAELARVVGVEQPTMAKTLQRMERDGLVYREADPADRRKSLIRLTPRGRELDSAVRAELHAVNAIATAGLRAEDIQSFLRVARGMLANLQQEPAE